ncbi:hypothetical protein [Natronococcus jeotgali]|nr:hypothetical protein [Natronococcus jeotgali]
MTVIDGPRALADVSLRETRLALEGSSLEDSRRVRGSEPFTRSLPEDRP